MIANAFHRNWFDRTRSTYRWAVPPTPFVLLRDEVDRLFSLSALASDGCNCADRRDFALALTDEGSHLKLTANLPGMSENDIDVKLTSEGLVLRGERTVKGPESFKARHRERRSYTFERNVRLPTKIDPDRVTATLINGVLTVTLPKAEAVTPRTIAVRAS